MKHNVLFLGIATAMLASCTIQEDLRAPAARDDVKFYASFEQPAEAGTKVFVNENLYLRWNANDLVSIFNKNTYNQQYRFLGENGANAGEFAKVESAEFVTGNAIDHVVSVYPYSSGTTISESEEIQFTFPEEQFYRSGSFGIDANPMVSVSVDNVLQFKNVGGYLTFSLYGDGAVNSITLQGNKNEKISGMATIEMPVDGVPSVKMHYNSSPNISLVLTFRNPVALIPQEDSPLEFWFVLPPTKFSQGFTVTVNTDKGTFKKSTNKEITIERNRISRMAPMKIEASTAPELVFEDPAVEALCLEWWDFDTNGKLTYEEAAAVTDLGSVFSRNESIVTFNELQYFTGLTEIAAGAFSQCSNLTSVKFPESLTTIGRSAFSGTALTSLEIPASVTEIDSEAFIYISGLTSIRVEKGNPVYDSRGGCNALIVTETNDLLRGCSTTVVPSTVEILHQYCFSGDTGITSFDIPSGVTTLGGLAFGECVNLTSVTVPASVASIAPAPFHKCDNLTSIVVDPNNPTYDSRDGCNAIIETETNTLIAPCRTTVIPESVTRIGQEAYGDNGYLEGDYVVPEWISFIGQVAYTGCKFVSITLPAGLKEMGVLPISYNKELNTLICNAPEPPVCTFGQYVWPFEGNGPEFKIYVPAESVEAYQAAAGWSHYADKIFPIQ